MDKCSLLYEIAYLCMLSKLSPQKRIMISNLEGIKPLLDISVSDRISSPVFEHKTNLILAGFVQS